MINQNLIKAVQSLEILLNKGPSSYLANKTVVDKNLKVHGIKGLRIADASIMPTLISGNTNAACMMIGERCADFIAKS